MILYGSILPRIHSISSGVSLSEEEIVCFLINFDFVPFLFFEQFVGFIQVVVGSILTVILSFGSSQLEDQFFFGFQF